MNGYCEKCNHHCPMDNLQCGRGRRAADGEGSMDRERGGRAFASNLRFFGERGPEGGHRRGFEHGRGRGRGPGRDYDRGPDFEEERGFGRGHAFDRGPDFEEERDFDHGGGYRGGFDHGGGFGHGHGPHGRPPMPDGDALRERVEEAPLSELFRLSGRLMTRDQGGPARGQALILSILAGRESLSQRELQQMLGVRPGSVSEIVTKLERKGLLTREKGDDRRGNLLRITDAGRGAIPESADDADDAFSALNDEQRGQLTGLLKTLLLSWIDRMR